MEHLKQPMTDLLISGKVAWTSAITTVSVGISTVAQAIPAHIGTIGAALGCVLTLVLIRSHWAKYRRDKREEKAATKTRALQDQKLRLEIEALQHPE